MSSTAGEPLFRVRNVYCRFEDFRRAIVDMAAPRGSLKKEMRSNPALFFDRVIVEDELRLEEGRIEVVGWRGRVLREYVLPRKCKDRDRSQIAIYRIIKLKDLPSRVDYRSLSGRSMFSWRRCGEQEGQLCGAVSKNSFRVLARRGIIPDYMVPNLEIETPAEAKHIRRLERLIVEKYVKRGWEGVLAQPGIHAEASGTFLRLYFEALEKRVLGEVRESGRLLQTVWVKGVLGVIARLEPDFNLVWRVKEWPHGILVGRINLQGLKMLSELGILGPETKLIFNPIMRPRTKKAAKQAGEDQPQAGGQVARE